MTARAEVPVLLSVCVDCLQLLANGEAGDPDCRPDREPLSALPEGADVTVGMVLKEHSNDCLVRLTRGSGEVECYCEDFGFSWSRCDGCGSGLGGDRFAATLWEES